MNKILLLIIILLGAGSFWYFSENTTSGVSNEDIDTSVSAGGQLVTEVMFEEDVFTVTFPEGNTKDYDVSLPYIMIGGEKVYLFGEDKNVWLRGHSVSNSGRYIYLGRGAGRTDASIQAYVFDVQNRELWNVSSEDGLGIGFSREEDVDVSWNANNALHIEYDNPGLAPGAPESGPAIGHQTFVSVSMDTPWIVRED